MRDFFISKLNILTEYMLAQHCCDNSDKQVELYIVQHRTILC